jgi:hypothetical protein
MRWLEMLRRELPPFILPAISTVLFITLIERGEGAVFVKFKCPN